MKKLLFIFNPHAGTGAVRGRLAGILDAFTKSGYLVTAYPTQCKADAARITAELGGQFDRIVCCGGDGTLSETIFGLLTLDPQPVLGYVPAGTTNDFSRNLHLPKGMVAAARTAADGPVRKCDVGLFNQKAFIYVAAFGAFTDVSYGTPQEFKNMFGHLAYLLEGVTRLSSIQGYHLEIAHDGGVEEGDFIYGMVSNTVSVGGFKGLPPGDVSLDDGLFEVMLVRKPKTMAELQSIIMTLLQQKVPDKGAVITFHTSRVRVTSQEPLPWTLDGEFGGDPLIAEIENRRQAISLVWGK